MKSKQIAHSPHSYKDRLYKVWKDLLKIIEDDVTHNTPRLLN